MMKIAEQNAEVGVIVARFQSPILHEGHQEILDIVIKNHPRVIVYLGLSPLKCTKRNPFDFAARKYMLEEKYPDIEIYYIEDVGDNDLWSMNLDHHISKIVGPSLKVVLYGSRDSFVKNYKGHYPTIDLVPSKIISASEIRRRVGIKSQKTQQWREGVVHAVENQYPSFKPTVDVAIINFSTNEVLLARKPNQKLLRFPGGFMDPEKDTSAEDAAMREALEETQLTVKVDSYIGSALVKDWRYEAETDKIMTFLYAMRYSTGVPVARDDVEYVCWKHVGKIDDADFVPEHRPLFDMFGKWYEKQIEKWSRGETWAFLKQSEKQ